MTLLALVSGFKANWVVTRSVVAGVSNDRSKYPLDFTTLAVSIIWMAIAAGLIYYSLRTLLLFKRNVATRAWIYICMNAIFSSMGVIAFLVESLSPMWLLPVGGVLESVGASFLFVGLRKNFLFWASKDHFT